MSVKSQKSDEEFINDLTSKDAEIKKDSKGKVIIEGALPQVNRKPKIDKTINGMRRINY